MTVQQKIQVAIIGGGPAGLMAAEFLAKAGKEVVIYDRMPSVGRKFLMAGRGGLNLTHTQDIGVFLQNYGAATSCLDSVIRDFPPQTLRQWCEDLGQETFVGSSGRIFPKAKKASPLLRAWLKRLQTLGVRFSLSHRWLGWDEKGVLVFQTPDGVQEKVSAQATLLALGGASWSRLGSDGTWVEILRRAGVPVATLRPANCGFVVSWSDVFRARFEGQPLKPVILSFGTKTVRGEVTITKTGIEGGAVYALSAALRDAIEEKGAVELSLDLRPDLSIKELAQRLSKPRGSQSLANHLRKAGGLSSVASALLREVTQGVDLPKTPEALAHLIKTLPLKIIAAGSLERAISSAGGVKLGAVDDFFMLHDKPGVFIAGEMLDWEAPTGGYLLQATFSTAVRAARGISRLI